MSLYEVQQEFPRGKLCSSGSEYLTTCPKCSKLKLYINIYKNCGFCFYCENKIVIGKKQDSFYYNLSKPNRLEKEIQKRTWLGLPYDHTWISLFGNAIELTQDQSIRYKQAQEYFLKRGFYPEEAQQAGLQVCLDGKKYSNRIAFPLTYNGKVYSFIARTFTGAEPKTLYPTKSCYPQEDYAMFGLDFCRDSGSRVAWLCEGQFDTLALGLGRGIALGGIFLKETSLTLLLDLFREFKLVFDNDKAGKQATEKYSSILTRANRKVTVINIPQGFKDLADMRQAWGKDKLDEFLLLSS